MIYLVWRQQHVHRPSRQSTYLVGNSEHSAMHPDGMKSYDLQLISVQTQNVVFDLEEGAASLK